MERKTLILIGAILAAALAAGIAGFGPWGPGVRESGWRAALNSGPKSLQEKAARELVHYPTSSSMLALVKVINFSDLDHPHGQALAGAALESLCILSQQDFGTGFRGDGRKDSADPALGKGWAWTIAEVNYWALEKFGATALTGLGVTPPPPREKTGPSTPAPDHGPDTRSFKLEPPPEKPPPGPASKTLPPLAAPDLGRLPPDRRAEAEDRYNRYRRMQNENQEDQEARYLEMMMYMQWLQNNYQEYQGQDQEERYRNENNEPVYPQDRQNYDDNYDNENDRGYRQR